MARRIPSVDTLIAFEAAARHQNFARAADEVALTQSAVCRQVCRLEEFLGQPLFNRVRRRLVLTDTGVAYARQVRETLARLERDTLNVMSLKATASTLNLAVAPTFSTRWLIPRMPHFAARHPEVVVSLSTRMAPFEFADCAFDAAIHFGLPKWQGGITEYLFGEELVPVCAPMLLGGVRRLEPTEFGGFSLLHQPSRQDSWARWFALAGVIGINAMKGPRYDLSSMLVEAAVAGLGIALVPRFFVLSELAAGRLIIPCELTLDGDGGYYFVYPENKRVPQALEYFKTWLIQVAEMYRNQQN